MIIHNRIVQAEWAEDQKDVSKQKQIAFGINVAALNTQISVAF
jgi:hypothetical protein